MKYHHKAKQITAALLAVVVTFAAVAEDKAPAKKEEKPPSDAELTAMMVEMGKLGENHKLLAEGVGKWTYLMKWWMDPTAPPSESTGTSVTTELMGGRYFVTEHAGKMQMPGADGKLAEVDFKGQATEGYDNVKKKFVSSWIDNMGTGIMLAEGTYDATAKSFTYQAECEMMPGLKTKLREVLKITDKNHRTFEYYEEREGKEVKTMEITYTRKS